LSCRTGPLRVGRSLRDLYTGLVGGAMAEEFNPSGGLFGSLCGRGSSDGKEDGGTGFVHGFVPQVEGAGLGEEF
jgi:hypothetical protein